MKTGRRWLAFDVDFLDNPFTIRLLHRFGPAGVVTWIAFLCACKHSATPGAISYTSDDNLRHELRIHDLDLVDEAGAKWSFDELWKFTGQQKQTARRRHGGRTHLSSTRYGQWQKDAQTEDERERKRRWRGQNGRDNAGTSPGRVPSNVPLEKRSRREENPPTPLAGGTRFASHSNGQGNDTDQATDFVRVDQATVAATRAAMRGEP